MVNMANLYFTTQATDLVFRAPATLTNAGEETTSYPESSIPLTSGRETSDPKSKNIRRPFANDWFASYLSNRIQFVSLFGIVLILIAKLLHVEYHSGQCLAFFSFFFFMCE